MTDETRVWPNEIREETRGIDAAAYEVRRYLSAARTLGMDVAGPWAALDALRTHMEAVDRLAGEWHAEECRASRQDVADTMLALLGSAQRADEAR